MSSEATRGGTSFAALTWPARMTTAALALSGVVDVAAVIVERNRFDVLGLVESGGSVAPDAVATSEHREIVIAAVQLPLFILTAIAFLWWFRRAYRNVEALGGRRRFGMGWTIGCWFVPLLCTWRPKQIANDLWLTSDPDRPAEAVSRAGVSPLVSWWWGLFLVSSWLGARAFTASGDTTLHGMRTSALLSLLSDGLDIAAVCLAVAVVIGVTSRQERRAERRAAMSWLPGLTA
jgi:uncharacterized protein DUF4328